MERLTLKSLTIISKKYKEAKIVEFDDKLTVITGDDFSDDIKNRTGKSIVMKSIYYALGANLKKYTSNWKKLDICTIIKFYYYNKEYELYRENECFILNVDSENLFFNNISELRKYYSGLFNFKIKLPVRNYDSNSIYAYPGAIFMPFYIDQDEGWSGSWDSFKDIFSLKWKEEILLYHLGIRTPEYYELADRKIELNNKKKENKNKLSTLQSILKNQIEKNKDYLDINVKLDDFAEEISELTSELSEQINIRNEIKENIVDCFNEMRVAEELYVIAERVRLELLEDISFIEQTIKDNDVTCPTCGIIHKNSIENHFKIYTDIQECEEVMQKYFDDKDKIEKKINQQLSKLNELEEYIGNINEILGRKRDSVTFREIILSEGSKSLILEINSDIDRLKKDIESLSVELNSISNKQSQITRKAKDIAEVYLRNLKDNLSELNVRDIDDNDVKKIKLSFNSGGNDLPCAIIAQIYSLYSTSRIYSKTVSGPIVLDAIFQQEPAKNKIDEIWDFIINRQPQESQLIISTTELHNKQVNGKVITLTKVQNLLSNEEYNLIHEKIESYKENVLLFKMKNKN